MKFDAIPLPSNRKFGFFFAVIFAAVFIYFYDGSIGLVEIVFGSLTVLTFFVAVVFPKALLPFNRLWMYIGYFLGRIISPIILGTIFFGLITPMGVIMRLFGRDELRLKLVNRDTHWKKREPIGPEPPSFKNQF